MIISFARAAPTMLQSRAVEPRLSGTPRSTSGNQNCAPGTAKRKSHASANPQPPPMAKPLIAAMLGCSRFSSRENVRPISRARRFRARANKRWRSATSVTPLTMVKSAPAQKAFPVPAIVHDRLKLLEHFLIDGIPLLWPIQCDCRDTVRFLDHEVGIHAVALLFCG